MEKAEATSVALIIIGLLIILHHYILWQRIVDPSDVLHHESFEAVFITEGIALLINTHHNKTRRRIQK